MRKITFQPVLPIAAGLLLVACGGSGGGSNGGQTPGDNSNDPVRAAVAGAAALSFAQSGISASQDADEGNSGAKSTEQVACDSGSQTITEDTGAGPGGGIASPYHSGDFQRLITSADACRHSASGDGFNFESYIDGMLNSGEAEDGRVIYIVASDQNGNYYNDFVTEFSGSAFDGTQSTRMGGIMHLCDGCSAPEYGHDIEMRAFMRMDLPLEQAEFSMELGGTNGTDATDQLSLRMSGTQGGAGEHEIYGRMAVDVIGTGCQFDARYNTLSPLVTENTFNADERVVSGEVQVTLADGGDFNVVISNGVISVNGVTYSQAELDAFSEDCSVITQ